MATVEEIIAIKVNGVQGGGRKKDFWDLHELLSQYSVTRMIALHKQRFAWTHDEPLIQNNFTEFAEADLDLVPTPHHPWIFCIYFAQDCRKLP
jgi:hypothetical protein